MKIPFNSLSFMLVLNPSNSQLVFSELEM
uniref:Uncharacterized protein n=1 Tax=Arundo donax TaxID=35708 RepID=A0A0A8ZXQ9_ARUDO